MKRTRLTKNLKKQRQSIAARNRPQKGSDLTVEPIRDLKALKRISQQLEKTGQHRNHLLFTLATNSGLRVGDLLKLKVHQVIYKQYGEEVHIRESKTGKRNSFLINKKIHQSLQNYIKHVQPADNDFLFKSTRGNRPLTIQAVNLLIKKWTADAGLKGRFGCHSLRKTWGYTMRTVHGIDFSVISRRYNHSSGSVTRLYLGVTADEVSAALMKEV